MLFRSDSFVQCKFKCIFNIYKFLGVHDYKYSINKTERNKSVYVRFLWLNRLLNSSLAKNSTSLLPKKLKNNIYKLVKIINLTKKNNFIKNEDDKNFILSKTVLDTENLESLTGLNLDDWKR